MKKKLFILIVVLILNIDVNALTYGGCDYSVVSRLKNLVTNINVSYDYHMVEGRPHFDVTVNNIVPGMYFIDTSSSKTYTYSNTNNGEITIRDYAIVSGSYNFYSAVNECYGVKLGTKYYKFPIYNVYYSSDPCKDVPNFSLCQKWASVNYTFTEFEEKVSEYKDSLMSDDDSNNEIIEHESTVFDKIVEVYIKNYYYFLGGIIVICSVIMIINRKKNKFKL